MKTIKSIRIVALIALGTLLFVKGYAQHATTFKFSETAPAQVLRVMENNANALFSEINQKYNQDNSQLSLSSSAVTDFARNRIANMWAVSHFYCTRTIVNVRVMKMVDSDAYQVRNIPICFKEGDGDEYKLQQIVLEFDKDGKVIDLYFTISEHDQSTVIANMDYKYKELINRYLNNYFTAYNCKDLALIEKMFGEDVLMITGKVVNCKTKERTKEKKPKIEYSVQNKQQYLANLRRIFQRNSFINIKIDSVEIIQSEANPKVYGVRLSQYWHVSKSANSTGYYDEGKLFFIIDFTNEDQPEIVVTAWQPFEDANGNPIEYSEEDFFSLGDFQIE